MAFQDVGIRLVVLGLGEFRRDTGMARSELNALDRAINGTASTLTSIGSHLTRLGQIWTMSVSAPILLTVGSLVNAGIQFEDAFAGVSKTVDGVSDDFGNLTSDGEILREQFRQLALEIPISVNELARIGELGGQLGITKNELKDFVQTVALLGVTTEMTSEDAATFFARFGNIMGIASDQMAEFTKQAGSTVVDLGNKFAATEPEIAALSLRIAGAGQAAGLTAPQILALSTALASLGIQSEMGGSALSRVLLEMKRATDDFTATGGEATDQLKLFAQAAGMTVDQFVSLVKNDPTQAFLSMIGGLNKMQEAGLVTNDMLKAMNLDTIRLQDVLNRLGPNIGLVNQALDVANKEWKTQDALQIEAQKRFNTTKSQIQLLKNAFTDLGIEIFDLYSDKIKKLVDKLRTLITNFKSTSDANKRFVMNVLAVAVAIGPVLIALGMLIQVMGTSIGAIGGLTTGLFGLVTTLGSALLPLLPVLLPALLLVAGAFLAVKGNLFGLGDLFNTISFWLKTLYYDLINLTNFDEFLNAAFQALKSGDFENAWKNFKLAIDEFIKFVNIVAKPLLQQAWSDIKDKIKESINLAVQDLKDWGKSVLDWVAGQIPKLKEQFKEWGKEFINWVIDSIPGWMDKASNFISMIITWLGDQIPKLIEKLLLWGAAFIDWLGPATRDILPKLGEFIGAVLSRLLIFIYFDLPPKILLLLAAFLKWAGDALIEIGPALGKFLKAVVDFILYSLIPGVVLAIAGFGKSFVDGLLEGLNTSWTEVEDWFNSKFQWIEDQWNSFWDSFSPSKKTEGWGENLIKGLINGLEGQGRPLNSTINSLIKNMDASLGSINDLTAPLANTTNNTNFNRNTSISKVFAPNISGVPISDQDRLTSDLSRMYKLATLANY